MHEAVLEVIHEIKNAPTQKSEKWVVSRENLRFVLYQMIRDRLSLSFEKAIFELPYRRQSSIETCVDELLPVFHLVSHNLRPIEIDVREKRVLLRTNPPEPWLHESFRYDEIWIYEKDGRIRCEWEKFLFHGENPRKVIPIALTFETFLALLQNLSRINL